jgi:hypothetical protein
MRPFANLAAAGCRAVAAELLFFLRFYSEKNGGGHLGSDNFF